MLSRLEPHAPWIRAPLRSRFFPVPRFNAHQAHCIPLVTPYAASPPRTSPPSAPATVPTPGTTDPAAAPTPIAVPTPANVPTEFVTTAWVTSMPPSMSFLMAGTVPRTAPKAPNPRPIFRATSSTDPAAAFFNPSVTEVVIPEMIDDAVVAGISGFQVNSPSAFSTNRPGGFSSPSFASCKVGSSSRLAASAAVSAAYPTAKPATDAATQ